jgi:hypothetical protein
LTPWFLEELLKGHWNKDGPAFPHKMLNAYVKALSDFDLLDADITITLEPSVVPPQIYNFEWKKIEQGLSHCYLDF